jgi:DNA-binding MarR family transcriptional regulator
MATLDRYSDMPIEDYLCMALYTASRAVTGLYRPLLDELGLTYPQYLVMRLLWQRGALRVKDIAAVLELDYGTLSPLLKRLEAAGLVDRSRRPDDERSVEIALTEAGAAMRGDAKALPGAIRCSLGLDDDSAVTDLHASLRQLTDSVNRAASAGS